MCQITRKAFLCHPNQRMSQFLGTIPAKHRGGSAGTGNLSRYPLLPSSQLPGFLCELGAVFSAGFLEAAGPPAKHISAALGWLEDSGRDVFEENSLLKIRRLSLALGCGPCSATHTEQENTGFLTSLELMFEWFN